MNTGKALKSVMNHLSRNDSDKKTKLVIDLFTPDAVKELCSKPVRLKQNVTILVSLRFVPRSLKSLIRIISS